MKNVKAPLMMFKERVREFKGKFRQDINCATDSVTPENELLPAREVPFPLSYIKDQVNRGDGDWMFELIVRGREVDNVEKAAEDVIALIEQQEFSVAEALMFLKYLEEKILTSPVKY